MYTASLPPACLDLLYSSLLPIDLLLLLYKPTKSTQLGAPVKDTKEEGEGEEPLGGFELQLTM